MTIEKEAYYSLLESCQQNDMMPILGCLVYMVMTAGVDTTLGICEVKSQLPPKLNFTLREAFRYIMDNQHDENVMNQYIEFKINYQDE
ncbi:MAG: hypothetical protein NW226_17605 [Microscillaceae bacterium]|nr:hypothetical protein [Microscillaceae bacterium]